MTLSSLILLMSLEVAHATTCGTVLDELGPRPQPRPAPAMTNPPPTSQPPTGMAEVRLREELEFGIREAMKFAVRDHQIHKAYGNIQQRELLPNGRLFFFTHGGRAFSRDRDRDQGFQELLRDPEIALTAGAPLELVGASDGSRVVIIDSKEAAHFYNPNGERTMTIDVKPGHYAASRRYFVVATPGGRVKVFDTKNGKNFVIDAHLHADLIQLSPSPHDKLAIVRYEENESLIQIHDVENAGSLNSHIRQIRVPGKIQKLLFSPNEEKVFVLTDVSGEKRGLIYGLETRSLLFEPPGFPPVDAETTRWVDNSILISTSPNSVYGVDTYMKHVVQRPITQ